MSSQSVRSHHAAQARRSGGRLLTLVAALLAGSVLAGPAAANGDGWYTGAPHGDGGWAAYSQDLQAPGYAGYSGPAGFGYCGCVEAGPVLLAPRITRTVVARYRAPAYVSGYIGLAVHLTAPYERWVDGGSVVGIPAPSVYRRAGAIVIVEPPIIRRVYRHGAHLGW